MPKQAGSLRRVNNQNSTGQVGLAWGGRGGLLVCESRQQAQQVGSADTAGQRQHRRSDRRGAGEDKDSRVDSMQPLFVTEAGWIGEANTGHAVWFVAREEGPA